MDRACRPPYAPLTICRGLVSASDVQLSTSISQFFSVAYRPVIIQRPGRMSCRVVLDRMFRAKGSKSKQKVSKTLFYIFLLVYHLTVPCFERFDGKNKRKKNPMLIFNGTPSEQLCWICEGTIHSGLAH